MRDSLSATAAMKSGSDTGCLLGGGAEAVVAIGSVGGMSLFRVVRLCMCCGGGDGSRLFIVVWTGRTRISPNKCVDGLMLPSHVAFVGDTWFIR